MRSRMWSRTLESFVGLGRIAILAAVLGAATTTVRSAPPPQARVLHTKTRTFRIPVTIPPDVEDKVREVRLWASDDLGYTWKEYARTAPDRPEFPFRAPRDGEYWFAVQTLDSRGKLFPSDDRTAEPTLKVIVDTAAPTITLEPRGRRGSMASVRWEVQDEYLVLRSLVLEYQSQGARDWRQVPLGDGDFALIGSKTWDAGTADAIRVRASIKDRAGNARQVTLTLSDGLAAAPSGVTENRDRTAPVPIAPISNRSTPTDDDPFASPNDARGDGNASVANPGGGESSGNNGASAAPSSAPAQTMLVGSPRFNLKYAVEDAGPDGPALVELWVTRDGGRSWSRQPEDTDRASPYAVELSGEGTFGLWLVVQSQSGLGDPPPAPGDRPQMWVEVDSSPPDVQFDGVRVGTGSHAGKVAINWRASDPHLGPKSVTISYRPDRPDAAWQPIGDAVDNTGQFNWTVPPDVPARFHVKIDVVDSLGNQRSAESTANGPIIVDRTRPKGRILGLDPSAQNGANASSRR